METIKISDADTRHKELMAGIAGIERALLLHAGIERALLLINDALRLRVVEVGPSNTQTEQEKVAAMQWQRKVRREDLAQALHEHGMTDSALRVLKQNEEEGRFNAGTKVLHLDKGDIGAITGQPSEMPGLFPVKWVGRTYSVYEDEANLEFVQRPLNDGDRVRMMEEKGIIQSVAAERGFAIVQWDKRVPTWELISSLELIGDAP